MLSKTIAITVLLLILLAQSFTGRSSATSPPQQTLAVCLAEKRRLESRLETQGRVTEQLQQCRAALERAGNSSSELKSLQGRFSEISGQLQNCQRQNNELETANTTLRGQLNDPRLKRDVDALDRELAEKKQELERCSGLNTTLNRNLQDLRTQQTTFDEKLKASADAAKDFQTKNVQLSGEVESLKTQLSAHQQQTQTTNDELQASKTSVLQLTQQLLSRAQFPANPEGVIQLARSSQAQTSQANAGIVSVYEENGKVHVIRELVIGTLKTTYEKEAKPEKPFPLQAVFKPHPIIAPGTLKQPASEESILWFIDIDYPSQKSKVTYDKAQSGQKDRKRQIDPRGGEETWSWTVVPPSSFDSDVSDLIVYAEYQLQAQTSSPPKDIVRENIKFKQITEPGSLTRGFAWLKENLTYFLGTITVVLGIWATWVKTKKDKLELRLKEQESKTTVEPAPGGQVSS